eukprot:6072295-Amphidinium_carterae.1
MVGVFTECGIVLSWLHKLSRCPLRFGKLVSARLLRPAEVLKLNIHDLSPDASRLSLVLRLRGTKTSQRSGVPESVVISHPETVTLALAACLEREGH